MNIYVIVEGEVGEKKVYESWIPFVNPTLSYVSNLFDIQNNHFAVLIAGGQSLFFDVVRNGIDDVNNHGNVDRLVVAIDSEEMTYQGKYDEVQNEVSVKHCAAQIHIVVQHFCLETWALGNRRIGPHRPQNSTLIKYRKMFNVAKQDPELLPPNIQENLNRAQFALKYLRLLFNERNPRITYTKSKPTHLLHSTYFSEVKKRLNDTGHIASFDNFLRAFV